MLLMFFVVGVLCAFGLLSALWAALGWLLPGAKGWALVCVGVPEEKMLLRCRWLTGLGLLDCPLIVVAEEGENVPSDMEICSREELISRLEWERNRVYGTGNGDHSGRHQRCGISEL